MQIFETPAVDKEFTICALDGLRICVHTSRNCTVEYLIQNTQCPSSGSGLSASKYRGTDDTRQRIIIMNLAVLRSMGARESTLCRTRFACQTVAFGHCPASISVYHLIHSTSSHSFWCGVLEEAYCASVDPMIDAREDIPPGNAPYGLQLNH